MKRALAERVKQEQEAAGGSSSSGPPPPPPSSNDNGSSNSGGGGGGGGMIHPKAPPSQLSAFDTGVGGVGGGMAMQGMIPPPSKMIRTAEDLALGLVGGDPPPHHLSSGGGGGLGGYGNVNGGNNTGRVNNNVAMEIPRRSLPPLPSAALETTLSLSTASQSHPHHQQISHPPPSPRSPRMSPGSTKKRPRTNGEELSHSPNNRIDNSTNSAQHQQQQQQQHRPESKRPSPHSSGNITAYKSQKSHSDNDDDDAPPTTSSNRQRSKNNKSTTKYDSSSSDNEDGPTSGKFYLQHQNKALASELYAYRRRIYLLERERTYRRRACRSAGKKVRELAGVWRGMEVALGEELGRVEDIIKNKNNATSPSANPVCTGLGTDVENVSSLLLTIKDLASFNNKHKPKHTKEDDDIRMHVDDMNNFENYSRHISEASVEDNEDITNEKGRLDEMDDLACHVADRAARLRDGILELVRVASSSSQNNGGRIDGVDPSSVPLLKERIVHLESELRDTEERLDEMAQARNEAVASERRVRRGLYRLASGRMSMEDVLKAVEKEDNGVSFMETIAMIDGLNNHKHNTTSPDGTTLVSSADVMSSPAFSTTARTATGDSMVNGEELAQIKKNLQDVQVIAESREKKISELLGEREELLKRINTLLLPDSKEGDTAGADDETVRKSSLFIETTTKLDTSERRIKELEAESEKIRQRWAVMKGDLELAKKSLIEMEGKHERRWNELISTFSESDSAPPSAEVDGVKGAFNSAKKIAELENKLRQSLEAVGRMETLRITLADAYKMNETLQSKLEDLKTKNTKLQAEKSAARAKEIESVTSPQAASSKKSSSESSSNSDLKLEKLKQEYRRVRKEVGAAVLSKDQAKLKQERAEKERDNLMKTNVRLLKQGSEKDDMNAKSLSTILHLKQRNEELEKENSIIKQKAEAAQQLSLAARLASNAKDRVGEEALREKELLDESVQKLRNECQSLRAEKQQVDGLLSQTKQKVNFISKDLNVARERCDELVSESNKKEEEKKHMMESLAVVKKEAMESAKKAVSATAGITSQSGVKSEFTMDQMTSQVKYLSDRINCPVCNCREKKCILLRCKHMFCRNCIDENIKNRSRKCPACAQRFDTKDVAEIWL